MEPIEIHQCWNDEKREFEDLNCNQWISVKDRLPEIDKNVLAYCPIESPGCLYIVSLQKINSLFWNLYPQHYVESFLDFDEVTHWMPLPETPK